MQKSNNLISIILCVIAVVSLALNVYCVNQKHTQPAPSSQLAEAQAAYKLYIVIPDSVTDTDNYIRELETILANRVPGYTMYPTRGGSHEDDGSMSYQTTLVCELYGTDKQTVTQIAHQVMTSFNVNSVPVATLSSQWEIIR